MLFDLLRGESFIEALLQLVTILPAVLFALTFHEVAHGYTAYKLGDPTAKAFGRLSLNPIKHLDPIGTVLMLLTGYGWAKPVPVNARYFKNPKRGMALTALAGPCTNLLLGLVSTVLYAFVYVFFYDAYYAVAYLGERAFTAILAFCLVLFFGNFAMINISYAIFNLFPVPPFDGSRILLLFLPEKIYFSIMRYERILMMIVLIGMATGILWTPIEAVINAVFTAFIKLALLILPV